MPKTQKLRKAKKPARQMVVVEKSTIYFPTHGDTEGQVHVQQKYLEAEATCNLLLAAIARSGTPLDLLDLPGTARKIQEHMESAAPTGTPVVRCYPGPSLVKQAVYAIRTLRELLDEEHKKAVAAGTLHAHPQSVEAQPESAALH